MEQPEGFRVPNLEHHIIRLKKALYGLKQAGLAWWQTLRDSMKELGFEGLISNAGLFIWRNKNGFVITVIYVDDALFCGTNKALVQELKEKFMKEWECQNLGDVTEFLCMKVHRDGSKISLDQCAYLETVRATLPSAFNVMNASSVGKLVQLVTAGRLILYHE